MEVNVLLLPDRKVFPLFKVFYWKAIGHITNDTIPRNHGPLRGWALGHGSQKVMFTVPTVR